MFGRSRDDEVSIAAFTGDLRANATIGRNQLFRLNGGPYLLCCFEKARMPALIDIIVDGADPFHIWPEARRARKVERKMGAQTAWFRRWIDEMPKGMFRSEEHTSELQSLMSNSYAVFCLNKKTTHY